MQEANHINALLCIQIAILWSASFNFPRYVIHTVGPRYNTKYKTAAESALFMCYRNVLQLARYVYAK